MTVFLNKLSHKKAVDVSSEIELLTAELHWKLAFKYTTHKPDTMLKVICGPSIIYTHLSIIYRHLSIIYAYLCAASII